MVDGSGPAGSTFDRAVELVLDLEGPPSNDPDDPGGETVFGLARRFHGEIPWPPTRDQAIAIYRHSYWAPVHGDELPPPLALAVFDAAVIPGPGWAAGALQDVLRVARDGVIGVETVAAARRSGWLTVLNFTAARITEFARQVRTQPFKTKFAAGWLVRCLKVYRQAVKLESAA